MKTKEEMMQMLMARLTELQDLNQNGFTSETAIQKANLAIKLQTELALLYDILGEDVPEEYWEEIEAVI